MNLRGSCLGQMPGQKLLLLSAWLSSCAPRSTRHRGRAVCRSFFLLDVLERRIFLDVSRDLIIPTERFAVKPRQTKVLIMGGGDLREAQVDVPLSVSHSSV